MASIVIFGSPLHSSTKQNVVKIGPPLTKLSASLHTVTICKVVIHLCFIDSNAYRLCNERSYVFFNLLKELRISDTMRGLPSILSLFFNEFKKNSTIEELEY